MLRKWRILLQTLTCLLAAAQAAATPLPDASIPGNGSRSFAETGFTVSGLFLDYWNAHGGLAQQGYPISAPLRETSAADGQVYTVQYFERAVFEYHPENGAQDGVVLPQLGALRYRQQYPNGVPGQQPDNSPGAIVIAPTGRRLGGRFLEYWRLHGGAAQQGNPISDEFQERSALDGKTYTVQYFERAVFELHPENAAPYDVLLSQLGTFRYRALYGGRPGPTATASAATPQLTPNSSPGAESSGPGPREDHVLVYDDKLAQVLLLNSGGVAGEELGRPGRLWGWNGSGWWVLAADGPAVRTLGGVTYDAARGAVVLYGGGTRARYYGDSWEWDGASWQQRDVAGPGLRHHVQMVYDAAHRVSVLYGGNAESDPDPARSSQTSPTDTWTWDGASWRQLLTPTGPGVRTHHALVYDAARQKALLFGGFSSTGLSDELWQWDGANWTRLSPQGPRPAARSGARMVYDGGSGDVLLFAGRTASTVVNDMWRWDGARWSKVEPAGPLPPPRSSHSMAYDAARARVVLYGGAGADGATLSDTWEWDGKSWLKR